MSSYIWKNSDTTDDDLKRIETYVNNTKTEVQNGMRSLMLQIGKIPNKDIATTTGANPFEDINKNMKTNFQRILTNQDIFLESCHRLQMDEAQIESEISVTLENLIDMIEKKMTSGMDLKNLERALKTHDSRIIRNAHQINSNVISLFEKYTKNNEMLTTEVKKIGNNLDDLSKFVQGTVSATSPSINTKILQDKLDKIENTIVAISEPHLEKERILQHLQRFSKTLSSIESLVNNSLREDNIDKILNTISRKHNCSVRNSINTTSKSDTELDDNTKWAINEIFGTNLGTTEVGNVDTSKSKCKNCCNQNLSSRAPGNCGNVQEKDLVVKKGNKKKKKKRPLTSLIDVRGNFGSEDDDSEENYESTTMDNTTQDLIIEETSTTETINEEPKPNNTMQNI